MTETAVSVEAGVVVEYTPGAQSAAGATAGQSVTQRTPQDVGDEFSNIIYVIRQMLAQARSGVLVRIKSVTSSGGLAPAGYVDAQPLINQVDGLGNAIPHGTIHNLLYLRMQGGTNAVIMDPQVGDIGLAVICDRDISSPKQVNFNSANDKLTTFNPGSRRIHDLADGLYIGGVLNGTPSTYIQFDGAGNINLVAPSSNKINLSAGEVILHGANKITFDAGGTGFVYQPSQIDTYTNGVSSTAHNPNPPEVPT